MQSRPVPEEDYRAWRPSRCSPKATAAIHRTIPDAQRKALRGGLNPPKGPGARVAATRPFTVWCILATIAQSVNDPPRSPARGGHGAGGADPRCPRTPASCPSPSFPAPSGAVRRGRGAPSPPPQEEESGEKRKGKEAALAASPVPAGSSGARREARCAWVPSGPPVSPGNHKTLRGFFLYLTQLGCLLKPKTAQLKSGQRLGQTSLKGRCAKRSDKHAERCPALLIIRKVHIEITARDLFVSIGMAAPKANNKQQKISSGEGVEERENVCPAGGNAHWCSRCGEQRGRSSKSPVGFS
ncbi:uncharacterized protein LOC123829054 [Phyllostomus hastatus]|uniref:uncharacterized protein LOC123829054 n=1 Tax=Phyllostomus hastatus TaxID=9423 RepID=UPI001E682857|nr:uncharacterized protein LOC123829054 [Phyllostomus hastatus]